jgi:predicted component of type VI protein secretion system
MNGTKLNGNLIEPHVATRLKPQDTITIGSQVLRVNFEQT